MAPLKDLDLIRLRPLEVNPISKEDFNDLKAQRIACGWKRDAIPHWVQEIKDGHRLLWFIHFSPQQTLNTTASIGMVSLLLYDPDDLSLANLRAPGTQAGDRVEIGLLFVYPEHSRKGVAGQVIQKLEYLAKELGASMVTMNTAIGTPVLEWYKGRLGYEEYKPRGKRYSLEDVLGLGWPEDSVYAAFLEKRLDSS